MIMEVNGGLEGMDNDDSTGRPIEGSCGGDGASPPHLKSIVLAF